MSDSQDIHPTDTADPGFEGGEIATDSDAETMTAAEIVAALNANEGDRLPVALLRAAQARRAEITPLLIESLRLAPSKSPDKYARRVGAEFYAWFLLTEFEAREALPVMVEALLALGDKAYDYFGDVISEVLPRALAIFAADRLDMIDGLAFDPRADEFVRGSSLRAYLYLVRDGALPRERVMEILRSHLKRAAAEPDAVNQEFGVSASIVEMLLDIGPAEAMAEINEAYGAGAVNEFYISPGDVQSYLKQQQSGTFVAFDGLGPTRVEDTVEELKRWGGFVDAERRWQNRSSQPTSAGVLPISLATPEFVRDFEPIEQVPVGPTPRLVSNRIGRNDPCPCGSGKKHKKCCGAS